MAIMEIIIMMKNEGKGLLHSIASPCIYPFLLGYFHSGVVRCFQKPFYAAHTEVDKETSILCAEFLLGIHLFTQPFII